MGLAILKTAIPTAPATAAIPIVAVLTVVTLTVADCPSYRLAAAATVVVDSGRSGWQ
jgi:hypothetical protein